MNKEVTGTEDKKSSPGENKFDKATDAMKNLFSDDHKNESEEADTPSKGGTQHSDEKKEDLDEKKEDQEDQEDKHDWKQRYAHVQSHADKMYSKAELFAESLVKKDPAAIHDIAKSDKELADKLVAKELGESHGIKTYDDFLKAVNANEKSDKKEKNDSDLEKRLEALEKEKEYEAAQKAEAFITQFKEDNPAFTGDIEKKTWELFEKSNLSLEEAFDYIMFKSGNGVKESEIEEKVYKKIAKQNVASSVSSSGSKGTSKPSKQINSAEKDLLEALGAKKTLKKYS